MLDFTAGKGVHLSLVPFCKLDCSQLQLLRLSGLRKKYWRSLVFLVHSLWSLVGEMSFGIPRVEMRFHRKAFCD